MTLSFACFISFQREKSFWLWKVFCVWKCQVPLCRVASFPSVASPVYQKISLLPNDYYHLVTCLLVVTISDNQCTISQEVAQVNVHWRHYWTTSFYYDTSINFSDMFPFMRYLTFTFGATKVWIVFYNVIIPPCYCLYWGVSILTSIFEYLR